jgi:apolipoprotein N-acyltransferase
MKKSHAAPASSSSRVATALSSATISSPPRALSKVHAALAILVTAAATALAAPPFSLSPFALVALAPMAWLVTRLSTWRRALAAGAAASCATTLFVFHWIPGSVHAFFNLPTALCWLVFPIYGLLGQPQLVVWAVARWQWRGVRDGRALIASAALYAGLDWLLPKLFRDTLGLVFFADRWVIQVADLGGLYLLTFAAVLAGEVTCAVVLERRRALPQAIGAGALWAAILIYGAVRTSQIEAAVAAAPRFSAGVVQANIGNVEKEIAARGDLDGIIHTLKAYGDLSDQLVVAPSPTAPAAAAAPASAPATPFAPPDLLVWPETAYPLAYGAHRSTLDDDVDHELANYVSQRKVPLLFGGYQRSGTTEYNSALLLLPDAPDGKAAAYHKFHLIPFGEYIPLVGRAKFGTGGAPRVLPLALPARTIKLGPVICYESLIPAHAIAAVDAGAQVLINLTNDSWFLSVAEKELHLAMAAVRSVETRRAQLRATNTGISALISPTGEITGRGPIDAPAALRYQIPILDEPATLVMRLGTWSGPAGLAVCMLLLVAIARSRRRQAAR